MKTGPCLCFVSVWCSLCFFSFLSSVFMGGRCVIREISCFLSVPTCTLLHCFRPVIVCVCVCDLEIIPTVRHRLTHKRRIHICIFSNPHPLPLSTQQHHLKNPINLWLLELEMVISSFLSFLSCLSCREETFLFFGFFNFF